MAALFRRTTCFLLALVAALAAATVPAPASAEASAPVVAAGPARVNDKLARDIAALPHATPYFGYVHFRGGTPASRKALLTDHGLTAGTDFSTIDATTAIGTLGQFEGLRHEPLVSYLESPYPAKRLGETARWASNVGAVQEAVAKGPYVDPAGRVLDGAGVGIAIIDSGMDAVHPDLAGRVARNYYVTCGTGILVNAQGMCGVPVFAEAPRTDTLGHGTHVAGIAAGDGTASRGLYKGVASGAKLYSYAINITAQYQYQNEAFNHILTNFDTFSPRIRVVNNSWGGLDGLPYDPNSVMSRLVKQLVAKGVTVVFSAGNGDALNNGGTGADDRLNATGKDPTPGVITVANYDDGNDGRKNGTLDFSSSRGRRGDPVNYPDISAPGTSITSTCSLHLQDCDLNPSLNFAPDYSILGGTSMSAPHVAGIAAMLYQLDPTLTPAQVEDVLQDTALRFGDASTYEADPQNPGNLTSFDKGAGLVDARAAVEALGAGHLGIGDSTGTPSLTFAATSSNTSSGAGPFPVSGSANDGHVAPLPFVERVLASGEAGDVPGPGAADITGLSVIEQADGLRYTVTVRDMADIPASIEFLLSQRVGTTPKTSRVVIGASSITTTSGSQTAVPTAMTRDVANDRFSFTLTWAALGNPASGTPITGVHLRDFVGVVHDTLPGRGAEDGLARQANLPAFSPRRPSTTPPPASVVTVSLDGGPAMPATLTGSSPSYDWAATVDTTGLAEGVHTVTASLVVAGAERATATQSFVVDRPDVHSVAVTSPADGSVVPRDVVTIGGVATSTAPAGAARRVGVRITGAGFDSTELAADGAQAWSLPLDVRPLDTGTYLVTAVLYVGDEAVATGTSTFVVPVFVSCRPQGLAFWREQYAGGSKARYTVTERNLLADRAVALSTGYFADRQQLTTTLFADGKLPAELTAARQFAALLLNLAAGDLSATTSYTAGLSGRELLSARTYDTARIGTTVEGATAFVRAQFPGGDLTAANDVATAISKGTGLTC